MKHQDFGQIDGPLVLFGGPYSNLQAMQQMAREIAGRPSVCTGDVVAYCAEPNETIDALVQAGSHVIAGNCEEQLIDGALDCGCGFEEGSVCDALSGGWWPYLKGEISEKSLTVLARLPGIGSFVHEGRRYAVIHGGATAINRFLWPSSAEADFGQEIDAIEGLIGPVDGVVCGHSGIAFQRMIGRYHWINAGAIGLPPHDGRPDTRYAVMERGEVTFLRLSYDHDFAREKMISAGLTQGYHTALTTGIWPSEDVLPGKLRRV